MQGNRRIKKQQMPANIFLLFLQTMFPDIEDAEINSRLVGYCSDQVKKLT
jgi:hypothetical protein